MQTQKLRWLRTAALFEGTSLIALVFVGLPLKYWFDLPIVVKLIGPVHGALFLGFITILLLHFVKGRIDARLTGIGVLASMIPFGSFVYKAKLLR
ncbi:hypothetical protein JI58_07475 [Marinosulfonomonas sp. PRT-SC04]|nr:hypothetical protein JI58_07475 [Marinosulfonomonas sp. PRT-SC04]